MPARVNLYKTRVILVIICSSIEALWRPLIFVGLYLCSFLTPKWDKCKQDSLKMENTHHFSNLSFRIVIGAFMYSTSSNIVSNKNYWNPWWEGKAGRWNVGEGLPDFGPFWNSPWRMVEVLLSKPFWSNPFPGYFTRSTRIHGPYWPIPSSWSPLADLEKMMKKVSFYNYSSCAKFPR